MQKRVMHCISRLRIHGLGKLSLGVIRINSRPTAQKAEKQAAKQHRPCDQPYPAPMLLCPRRISFFASPQEVKRKVCHRIPEGRLKNCREDKPEAIQHPYLLKEDMLMHTGPVAHADLPAGKLHECKKNRQYQCDDPCPSLRPHSISPNISFQS